MAWRRKIETGGAWWAQARDGSWARWDGLRGDWVPQPMGPPGGAPALEPEGAVHAPEPELGGRERALHFATTWAGLLLPGLLTLGLTLVVLVPLGTLWNAIFSPWLGPPVRLASTLAYLAGALVAVTLFMAIGGTLIRTSRRLPLQLAGAGVIAGGTLLSLVVVARMLDVSLGELMARQETALAAIMILAGYFMAWWFRFRRED